MRYYSIVIICLVLTGCNVNNNKLPDEEIKSTKVINKNEIQFASKYKKKPVDSNVPMIKYCQEQNIKKKEKIVNEFVKAREQEFKDNATKFHSTQGMRKEYAEEYGKELPKNYYTSNNWGQDRPFFNNNLSYEDRPFNKKDSKPNFDIDWND